VAGIGTILDRSGGQIDFPVRRHTLAILSMANYPSDSCPLCQQGSQPEKPGSRQP
jgi:orotate phosphoribosyltransferase